MEVLINIYKLLSSGTRFQGALKFLENDTLAFFELKYFTSSNKTQGSDKRKLCKIYIFGKNVKIFKKRVSGQEN